MAFATDGQVLQRQSGNRLSLHALSIRGTPSTYIGVALLLAFVLRLVLTLTHHGLLGVDGGAYVLSAQEALGKHVPPIDIPRPPLAPGFLLAPFIKVLGIDLGYKLFTAIGSMAIFPGFILFAKRYLKPWQLVAATAFLAVDMTQSELAVTGVLPVIGFGIMLFLLACITEVAQRRDANLSFLGIILGMPALALVNQTTTGIAAVLVPIYILALWKTNGIRFSFILTIALFFGCITSLVALPWYLGVLPGGTSGMRYPGAWIFVLPTPMTILAVMLLAFLSIFALVKSKQAHVRALAITSLALCLLMPWASYDESLMNIFYRSHLFAPAFITVLATWAAANYLFPAWKEIAWIPAGTFAAIFVLLIPGFVWNFNGQTKISDMITPAMNPMVQYIKDNPNGKIITNGWSITLWQAALTGEDGYWTWPHIPPVRFQESDKQVRCVLGWVEGCDAVEAKTALQAGYVLVDARHQIINKYNEVYEAPEHNPWFRDIPNAELVMESGTARLWRLN